MASQRGNVLFLILIAVALFAALSYAVTKSTSGGGNADNEQLSLHVSTALNQVSSIRTEFMRRTISGGTLALLKSAGGMYDSDGISIQHPPLEIADTTFGGFFEPAYAWTMIYADYENASGDLGTASRDYFLTVSSITQGACKLLNKEMTGSDTITTFDIAAGTEDMTQTGIFRTGGVNSSTNVNIKIVLQGDGEACYQRTNVAGNYVLFMSLAVH